MKKSFSFLLLCTFIFLSHTYSASADSAPLQNPDDREKQEICWICKKKDFTPFHQVGDKVVPQYKSRFTSIYCPDKHPFHHGCFVMGALFLKGKPVCLHNECHAPVSLTLYKYPRTPADTSNDSLSFHKIDLGAGIRWGTEDYRFIMAHSNDEPQRVTCHRFINNQDERAFFIGLDGAVRVLKAAQINDKLVTAIGAAIIQKELTDTTGSAPSCIDPFFKSLRENAHSEHPHKTELNKFINYLNQKRK